MATDTSMGWGRGSIYGTPFCVLATSSDTSTNGSEAVPAVTGQTPYVQGYQISSVAAITMTLSHTAAAAGKTAIGPTENMAANTTTAPRIYPTPIAGAEGKNVGFVGSGAGAVTMLVWGYYR